MRKLFPGSVQYLASKILGFTNDQIQEVRWICNILLRPQVLQKPQMPQDHKFRRSTENYIFWSRRRQTYKLTPVRT